MINYKFLLHEPENKPPFQEWSFIPPITEEDISKIEDSVIKSTSGKIGTSIPTPLARLFTFKTAFSIVNKQLNAGEIDVEDIRQSIYGGIVSDCLDFLEWIFVEGINNFEQIPVNLTDNNDFGVTPNLLALSKAFNSTISSYFNKGLTITLFKHKQSGFIVGGTSPYSLLYTSPNWRREVKQAGLIQLRGLSADTLFDDTYCLLHSRNINFVSYLNSITNPILDKGDNSHPLKGFAEYVQTTIKKFGIIPQDFKAFDLAVFSPSHYFSFGFKKIDIESGDLIQSDFYLDKNLQHITSGNKPLVLSSKMTLLGQYVKGKPWSKDDIINFNQPYHSDLNKRKLPNSGIEYEYPFIIDSDLFQPKLIEVSYNINNNYFHTIESLKYGTRFLLPVKPLFFEIIGLDHISFEENLKVEETGNILKVTLFIPIIGSDGRYQKTRMVEFIKEYSIDTNSGKSDVNVTPFECAFFPFFRRIDMVNKNNHNKIILWLEKSNVENKISSILFYDNNLDIIGDNKIFNPYSKKSLDETKVDLKSGFPLTPVKRMEYGEEQFITNYFSTHLDFRLLEIKLAGDGYGGLLIPKFIELKRPFNKKFKYAIDFGTTNTHIEYAEMNHNGIIENTKSPFKVEISGNVPQINEKPLVVLMHKNSETLGDLDKVYPILMREFMPPSIGNDSNYYNIKFPTRSVMLDYKTPKNDTDAAFLHSNIAFKIGERDDFHPQAIYTPDLKWLLEDSNEIDKDIYKNRIRMFFEQLFYMIKYKATMDDCDEDGLTLCFTRPMSMKDTQLNTDIQKLIKLAIKKVFENDPNDTSKYIFELDESLAPYENNRAKFTNDSFCNIDIGGGTTDILFAYKINNVDYNFYLTSFRFAGNVIWGNEADPKTHNGIIQYFTDIASAKSKLHEKSHPFSEAFHQYNQYYLKGVSDSELVSVLFKNNEVLKFTETVFTNCIDFKLLLFIHYSAILYFVNFVYKKYETKLKYETTLSLSGNGSLYLNLIPVTAISNLLLKKFSNSTSNPIDGVIKEDFPKEITARGALLMKPIINQRSLVDDINSLDDDFVEVCIQLKEHTIDGSHVDTNSLTPELTKSLSSFFSIIIDLLKTNEKLKGQVGNISNYAEMFNEKYYAASIMKWLHVEKPNLKNIDSVFFKPLKYILFDLSNAIYEKNKIR